MRMTLQEITDLLCDRIMNLENAMKDVIDLNKTMADKLVDSHERILKLERWKMREYLEENDSDEYKSPYNLGNECMTCDAPRIAGGWCDTFACGTSVGYPCGGKKWGRQG